MKPIAHFSALFLIAFAAVASALDTPAPLEPLPTPRQLAWHEKNYALYLRLGMTTFTGVEPTGREDPALFNPAKLDVHQWINFAKECGFKRILIAAKDNDGFCLWPSKFTEHSVKNSPWRSGKGDLIKEFADAAHDAGLEVGLHLSAEDRNNPAYGTPEYNAYYINQLKELLTSYGPIDEIRFDGAGGEGAGALPSFPRDAKPQKQKYDWPAYIQTIRALQPNAIIVSNIGPDARWNGNNIGHAGEPNWSPFDPAAMPGPLLDDKKQLSLLNSGDPAGKIWCPSECFILDRPSWYWRAAEDAQVLPTDKLVNAYCKSVGRNCVLMVNVPLNADGLIPDADAARLLEVHTTVEKMFRTIYPEKKRTFTPASGNDHTATLEVDYGEAKSFNVLSIAEDIAQGQRIETYHIEVLDGDAWKPIVKAGRSVGRLKIERFPVISAAKIRLVIDKSRGEPIISAFSVYAK